MARTLNTPASPAHVRLARARPPRPRTSAPPAHVRRLSAAYTAITVVNAGTAQVQ